MILPLTASSEQLEQATQPQPRQTDSPAFELSDAVGVINPSELRGSGPQEERRARPSRRGADGAADAAARTTQSTKARMAGSVCFASGTAT